MKKRFSYGCFENGREAALIGFMYHTRLMLKIKLLYVHLLGWKIDNVYCAFKDVEELPTYVNIVY